MKLMKMMVVVPMVLSVGRLPSDAQCVELSGTERTRLIDYVAKKYDPSQGSTINLIDASAVRSTCYRKLTFQSSHGRPLKLTLYASPDLRFLARELLDTQLDPVVEERLRQEQLSDGLTKGNFPTKGSPNALVTLVVFSDFQCPFCARMADFLNHDVLTTDPDKVRVVFRFFPLPMHSWARTAAGVAACAHEQGDGYFWNFHDFIFSHQGELTVGNLIPRLLHYSEGLPGFNEARFQSCLSEERTAGEVERDLAFANDNGITSTPTIFVNQHRINGMVPDRILSVIRELSSVAPHDSGTLLHER